MLLKVYYKAHIYKPYTYIDIYKPYTYYLAKSCHNILLFHNYNYKFHNFHKYGCL